MPSSSTRKSHYRSSEGARHRSSGSNVTRHRANYRRPCVGVHCDEAHKAIPPGAASEFYRYDPLTCQKLCPPGAKDPLCVTCSKKSVAGKLNARTNRLGPSGFLNLAPFSRIRVPGAPPSAYSEMNRSLIAKEEAKMAKAVAKAAEQEAKAAAKVAKAAEKEAKAAAKASKTAKAKKARSSSSHSRRSFF